MKEYFFITKFHFFTTKYDFSHKNFTESKFFLHFVAQQKGICTRFFPKSLNFQRKISTSFIGELAYFFKESEVSLNLPLSKERVSIYLSKESEISLILSLKGEWGIRRQLTSFH